MTKKSKKFLLFSSFAILPFPIVTAITAVSCKNNLTSDQAGNQSGTEDNQSGSVDGGGSNGGSSGGSGQGNNPQTTTNLDVKNLYDTVSRKTKRINKKNWSKNNSLIKKAIDEGLSSASKKKITLKEITNASRAGEIEFKINENIQTSSIINPNTNVTIENKTITIVNLPYDSRVDIVPNWDLKDDIPNADGNVDANVTFVAREDINNIDNATIYPDTVVKPYLRQLIKDNKKLFFENSVTVNENIIDKAKIDIINCSLENSQVVFKIKINKNEKTFVINNITFARSTYVPIPDPNSLFVENYEIDCIDIPPTPNRYADEQFWVKGLIARNKGWFFSDPDIPNSVIVNSTIRTTSSSCLDSTYDFEIKATYESKIYKKSFKLVNLNLCQETYEGVGKLVIENNPDGYTTLAPALTKETAIIKNDQITNPTANYLKLDVWSNSNTIDKFSVDLSTNASDVFVLDATGFCNPNPLTWEIAPEDVGKGFTLVNNKLTNINPLIKNEAQSVRLVSTISEDGKQTKHVDIIVNFHLGLEQPTQPDQQPIVPGATTTIAPKKLKSTWAKCLNRSHVGKGVKVDINDLVVEALTEDVAQQDLVFVLNESADKVFDLTGTNFSSNATVEWSIKDPNNSVFVILEEDEGNKKVKKIENFAPIIGAEGLSTIVRAKIVEANKSPKYVDISLTFRGNGPCEARPRLDFSEIAVAAQDEDFFVLPGKNANDYNNRITIPTTANHGIVKKYGNAPLPWKDDNDLTDNDLTNMFNYLAINDKWGVDLTFGQRKIETSRLANVYFQWLRTTWWKYFPYYSFANPNRIFGIKTPDDVHVMKKIPNLKEWVNNKTWYVDSMQKGTYASEWLKETKERNDFFEYINGLLTQIRPGMNDLDKFFTCWRYLDNWVFYDKSTPTGVSSGHTGVCIDYASNLALLLNIVGIQAVPNTCGEDELGMRQNHELAVSHGMTFAYLDLGNGKQWYGSDPTFSDAWGSSNISSAKAPSAYENTKVMLYSLSDSTLNHPTKDVSYQQYFGNQFFGLPWNYIWNENETIGKFSTEDFNWNTRNKWINNTLPEGEKFKISNPIYNNGKWYFFKKGIQASHDQFVYTNGLFDNKYVEYSQLPPNLVFNDDRYRPLLLNSYNNWAMFCAHHGTNSNNNIVNSIALVKMTNTGFDFNNIQYIPITSDFSQGRVLEFYITLDGKLHVFGTNNNVVSEPNVHKIIDLQQNYSNIWNQIKYSSENQPPKDLIDTMYNYFFTIGGVYQIGNKNGQVKIDAKKAYFEGLTRVYNDKSITSNWAKILSFVEEYKKYTSNIKKVTNTPFIGSILNKQYLVSREIFKIGGINLELYLYLDPSMISSDGTNIVYEFSYQKEGSTQFVPIGQKSNQPKIKKDDFIKAGFNDSNNGTLKVRYYPELHSENAIEATTKIIFTDDIDTTISPYAAFYNGLTNFQQSNYLPNLKGWENNEIIIKFNDLGLEEMKALNPTFTIKRINPSNMQIETIRSNLDAQQAKSFEMHYSDVSNDNHGIYWIEASYNYNGQAIKTISKFTFIFTKNDIEDFDSNLWIDAIKKINA